MLHIVKLDLSVPSNINLTFMKKPYSTPKLVKYDDLKKTWYVYFRYQGKTQPIKRTGDINRFASYKERERAGAALAEYLLDKLKKGWNPLVPDLPETEASTYTLFQALEFAIEKKRPELDKKTISTYEGSVRFFKTAISELGLGNLSVQDTKRVHIKTILETTKKQRKWSNKAYNKHLGHLQALLSECVQWDVIEVNPAHNINKLKVERTNANTPPTASELKLIKEFLIEKHHDFYAFVEVIFHTGIRPIEISKIKFENIDINNRQFILPASITKGRVNERVVPINNHLWETLKPRFTTIYPKDYYLFGSHRPSGKGNRGLHKDFIPAPTKMKRGTCTTRWERLIKIGLGIDKNLYGMKKAGANAKIIEGMSVRALQELFGHRSEVTTEIYITNLKDALRQEILDKSPAM